MFRIAILFLGGVALGFAAEGGAHTRIRTLLDKEQYLDALAEARDLNRRVPDDVAAYEFIAQASLGLGHVDDAVRAAQWMLDLRLGKVSPSAARVVAAIRKQEKDYRGAVEILLDGYRRIGTADEPLRLPMLRELEELYRLDNREAQAGRIRSEIRKLASSCTQSSCH